MDSEAWYAVVHGVAKSQTWLSDWTELNWIIIKLESDIEVERSIIWCICNLSTVDLFWLDIDLT